MYRINKEREEGWIGRGTERLRKNRREIIG